MIEHSVWPVGENARNDSMLSRLRVGIDQFHNPVTRLKNLRFEDRASESSGVVDENAVGPIIDGLAERHCGSLIEIIGPGCL